VDTHVPHCGCTATAAAAAAAAAAATTTTAANVVTLAPAVSLPHSPAVEASEAVTLQ
jgi:hypothetical protein